MVLVLVLALFWAGRWGNAHADEAALRALVDNALALTAYSYSGQFIIHGSHATVPSLEGGGLLSPAPGSVTLEAQPLAVSCERIKEGVLRILGLPDRWRGPVHVWLWGATNVTASPEVAASYYADGWRYNVRLPDQLASSELVRTVVYVVLLELANRAGTPRIADIPRWLVEGLTGTLLAEAGPDLVLQPNALLLKRGNNWGALQSSTRNQHPAEVWRGLRARLGGTPPLSFGDLSLPAPNLITGTNLAHYRDTAQVFVEELLRLPHSRPLLQGMLVQLSAFLNWQVAFLHAYHAYFPSLLSVEKWWALTLLQYTGRDTAHTWPPAVTLQELDQVLAVPVEIRANARDLPKRGLITLQQAIENWDGLQQTRVLRTKVEQLLALDVCAAQEVRPLVEAYQRTLSAYLEHRRQMPNAALLRGQSLVEYRLLIRDVLRRLDTLDRQRAKYRAAPPEAAGARQA